MENAPFMIVPSHEIDPQELTRLVSKNYDFWNSYFPVTVKKNETLTTSLLFLIDIQVNENARKLFLYGIRDNSSGALCGLVYLKNLDWETKEGELAYAIDKELAGKGWTSKAVAAISQKGFNLGLETLRIICHKSNKGSVGVAVKCHYIWKETLPNAFTPPDGKPVDMELYTRSNLTL